MIKYFNTLIILGFLFILEGCALFKSKYQVDQNKILTKENLIKINSAYNDAPILTILKNQLFPKKTYESDTSYRFRLSAYISKNEIEKEARVNKQYIKLQLLDNNHLAFIRISNLINVDTIVFKYVLKNDGYLYLKNNNFKINGFPFIFGGYEINRRRIGLNSEDNLIFESSYYIYGAALIFIGDDRKVKQSSLFKKIDLSF